MSHDAKLVEWWFQAVDETTAMQNIPQYAKDSFIAEGKRMKELALKGLAVPESGPKQDIEAVKWAIALLADHPGVKVNPNSQMWLRRLRVLAGATEDELMVASVDGFLDAYCDGVVTESGDKKLRSGGPSTP